MSDDDEAVQPTPASLARQLKDAGITQEQAALLIGVSQPQVSRYLSGERPLPASRLIQIAQVIAGARTIDAPAYRKTAALRGLIPPLLTSLADYDLRELIAHVAFPT